MCISLCFFANDLLLAVHFKFILDYGNVRQKSNSSNFLEFKMGCKAEETTCNINNTFDPGTANASSLQWWFKKFCKGDESLEDGEPNDQPLEVDNHQWRAIIKADPLITTRHLAFEANWKGEKVRQVGAS